MLKATPKAMCLLSPKSKSLVINLATINTEQLRFRLYIICPGALGLWRVRSKQGRMHSLNTSSEQTSSGFGMLTHVGQSILTF